MHDRNRPPSEPPGHRATEGREGSLDELARELLVGFREWASTGRRRPDLLPVHQRMLDDSVFAAAVWRAAEPLLLEHVDRLWRTGWQPREVHREARRSAKKAAGWRLVDLAVANDDAARPAATLDLRWRDQIDGLQLPPADGGSGWVTRWVEVEGLAPKEAFSAILNALRVLCLPGLEVLIPPPGASGDRAGNVWTPPDDGLAGAEADPVLQKIRALLAKAESSTFEAEATAFTLKAQELMTRHAIDSAMLSGPTDAAGGRPVMARIPLDAPYMDAKSLLLQQVAEQTRCRALFLPGVAMSSVVGFAADVAATELLFTSLLVQAESAMAEAARHAPAGTRTRSQAFRSSFLLAFARRIHDRLQEINDAVYADVAAERGGAFLPVLLSRQVAIDDLITERFGPLSTYRPRGGHDPAGWASGKVAADNARLNLADVGATQAPRQLS